MSDIHDISKLPDQKEIAKILIENKFLEGSIEEIVHTPEFQVFRIIGQAKLLTTEQIEERYETSQSLSMILSNLQADNLIQQSSEYRWRISDDVWELIEQPDKAGKENTDKEVQEPDEQMQKTAQRKALSKKKHIYKRIADTVSDLSYIPIYRSVEELFEIPEVEILALIYEHQPITTDDLERKQNLDTSTSLALSNLQADDIIEQTSEYKWKLTDGINQQMDITDIDGIKRSDEDEDSQISIDHERETVVEHKQLIKALSEIGYFENKDQIAEILKTPEFQILNVINSNSPISTEEIEEYLDDDILLSLHLSNLKADDLIDQENDYRWVLDKDFRLQVSKVKVSKEEIKEQIKYEQELQELQSKEKPEDQKQIQDTDKPDETIEKESFGEEKPKEEVNAETIEDTKSIESGQKKDIEEPLQPMDREKSYSQTEGQDVDVDQSQESSLDPKDKSENDLTTKSEDTSNPLISELVKNNYIDNIDISSKELEMIPEYELLRIIAKHQPISSDELAEKTTASSTSLTISNLQADGLIDQTNNYLYKLSQTLENKLKLKQPQLFAEDETDDLIEEVEEETTIKEPDEIPDEDSLENLKIAIRKKGYIEDETASEGKLMDQLEYEIIKIVDDQQPVSDEIIKSKVESESPVLISRTISKLEADAVITRTPDKLWIFTKEFEDLILEEERKEQERIRKEKERKKEERERKEAELKQQLADQLSSTLQEVGIIDEENELKKLLSIPEFEIIWHLVREDGLFPGQIKSMVTSLNAVLITRTLTQLAANDLIKQKDDKWIVTEKITDKISTEIP